VKDRVGLLLALIICLVCSFALASCGAGGPLLSKVTVSPEAISPNGDGNADTASLSYHVGQAKSTVTIKLVDANGVSHTFRNSEPRSAGDYAAVFSGVVENPIALTPYYTVTQASVLPDGQYVVDVEVADKDSATESLQRQLTIRGGDAAAPGFGDFSVFTPSFDAKFQSTRGDKIIFTPNQDGIGDRVAVSYWLTKNATVEVYLVRLDDPAHTKYPIAPVATLKPGRHEHDYEGGVDLGNTPPPDGEYLVVGEATDAVGNHAVVTRSLTIADGGVPLAQIISSSITPTSVTLGGTLKVEVTVENVGPVAIRSQGPYSGTVYTTDQNYNTLGYYENPGVFRVGADFEGNAAGRIYPFRWGFTGDTLLPGQRQTVVGYIQITEKTPAPTLYFWTGLIHEQVRVVNDKVTPVKVSVGF
jgi:hypothetical protein